MAYCVLCFTLQNRLERINAQYVSLVLRQDRIVRDRTEGGAGFESLPLESTIQRAENIRAAAMRDLLSHSAAHHEEWLRHLMAEERLRFMARKG